MGRLPLLPGSAIATAAAVAAGVDEGADHGGTGYFDEIVVLAGDDRLFDLAAGHAHLIVTYQEVDRADAAAGHRHDIAIGEYADYVPAADIGDIPLAALVQRADRAAGHGEIVFTTALADSPADRSAAYEKGVPASCLDDTVVARVRGILRQRIRALAGIGHAHGLRAISGVRVGRGIRRIPGIRRRIRAAHVAGVLHRRVLRVRRCRNANCQHHRRGDEVSVHFASFQ